jgi:hypothetical protein
VPRSDHDEADRIRAGRALSEGTAFFGSGRLSKRPVVRQHEVLREGRSDTRLSLAKEVSWTSASMKSALRKFKWGAEPLSGRGRSHSCGTRSE